MGMIKLSSGFSIIPEGTHVFQITNVIYKEDFGKLEIHMQTQNGGKHIERYSLLRSDGTTNEGAFNAFSYFARTALNDYSIDEIDPAVLVGRFIECDVAHDVVENKNKPGQTVTFVRLTDKRVSDGWDVPTEAPTTAGAKPVDLASLLG